MTDQEFGGKDLHVYLVESFWQATSWNPTGDSLVHWKQLRMGYVGVQRLYLRSSFNRPLQPYAHISGLEA
jgi:hypothetical protein